MLAYPDRSSISRPQLFGVALLNLFIFLSVYFFAVRTELGQTLEKTVLDESHYSTSPDFPLSFVNPVLIITVMVITGAYSWYSSGLIKAVFNWFLVGFSLLGTQALKLLLPRWNLLAGDDPQLVENTLPSGHMSVTMTLTLLVLNSVPKSLLMPVFWASGVLNSITISQLLAYGWHRPSDIIGAITVTIFVFSIAAIIAPGLTVLKIPEPRLKLRHQSVTVISSIAAVVFFGALAFIFIGIFADASYAIALGFTLVCILWILLTFSYLKAMR